MKRVGWPETTDGKCAVCGAHEEPGLRLEHAHVIPRRYDERTGRNTRRVDRRGIVTLCRESTGGGCHPAYDAGRLDLLPHLSFEKQAYAVERVGIVSALRYISGRDRAARILEDE